MTAIWQNDGDARKLLSPEGFPAEAALHDLVAQSPELLPLSGSPRLAVLGREVQLGTGYADILAIEDNGRLVVIEVKLSRNSEARRAVVAQVLAYAAYLDGMDADELETGLSRSLAGTSIRETVSSSLGDVRDWRDVEEGLRASLAEGWFRLVLVLDEAPDDLVRLVGYLKRITSEQIIVDLVTVASYAVEGTQVVVPQRVDARSRELAPPDVLPDRRAGSSRAAGAPIVQGSSAFEEFLPEIVGEHRERLAAIAAWTKEIESRGHALLRTSIGSGRRVLRVQVLGREREHRCAVGRATATRHVRAHDRPGAPGS